MESSKHHNLVKKIYDYVTAQNDVELSLIESDIFEVSGNVTRMPEGFVPDVYYKNNNMLIIGEAKTDGDIEREHSIQQYTSYCNNLGKYVLLGYKCFLIIAVPWEATITVCRIIKNIVPNNVKLIVINEVGVYKEYEKNQIKK